MAWTDRYANFDLATGLNDGTSEANAWQSWSDVASGYAAGDRINVKKTASRHDANASATVTLSTSGTASAPVWFRAYETTIGDDGLYEFQLTGNAQSLNFSGSYILVEGFYCSKINNQNTFKVGGYHSGIYRCKIETESGDTYATITFNAIQNSYIAIAHGAASSDRLTFGGVSRRGAIVNSRIEGVPAWSDCYSGGVWLVNSVFANSFSSTTYPGLVFLDRFNFASGGLLVSGCKFYGEPSGGSCVYFDALGDTSNDQDAAIIIGNVFESADYAVEHNTVGTNASNHGTVRLIGNKYRSMTSGFTTLTAEAEFGDNESLSGSPFTSASGTVGSGDYSLNDTANAGAVVRAFGVVPINEPMDWTTMLAKTTYEGSSGGSVIHRRGVLMGDQSTKHA